MLNYQAGYIQPGLWPVCPSAIFNREHDHQTWILPSGILRTPGLSWVSNYQTYEDMSWRNIMVGGF